MYSQKIEDYEEYFTQNCSTLNPFDTQPTHFTQIQNTLITNPYDLTTFIILHLLGDLLLYYQLRQIGKIYKKELQGIPLNRLKFDNQFLLFLGLFQQLGFSYLIFAYLFQKQSQALSFALLHYQLLLSNVFLNFIAIDQLKDIKQESNFFLAKYGKMIVLIISVAGLIFCTVTAVYKCCRQVIDAYQNFLIFWTFITNLLYIYSTFQFYKSFKKFEFPKEVKWNLKISIIIIFVSLLYREIYQFMRLLPAGREKMLNLKIGDPLNNTDDINRWYWSIFILVYFAACDIFARFIFIRLLKPGEKMASIN